MFASSTRCMLGLSPKWENRARVRCRVCRKMGGWSPAQCDGWGGERLMERSSVFLMLFLLWTCIRSQTWSQSGLPAVEICQLPDSKLDHAAPSWTAYWKRSVSQSICGICVLSLPPFAGRLGRLIPFSLLNSPVVSQRMLTLPAPPPPQPTLGRGCSWDEVTVFRHDRDLSSQHTSSSPMWTDPRSARAWASSSNQMFQQNK